MKLPVIIVCMISLLGCKDEGTLPASQASSIRLTVEDVSCTEAWLKATTTETPATVRLLRDGQRVSVIGLRSSDSLLLDEGLLPRRTYTYQLQKLAADSSVVETSASVQVTTMDTTSHQFQFQIDTLGVTSSVLYDVAIINDTLAYAVGEMYLRDSTGGIDPTRYNLAVWNGTRWSIRRLAYYFQGQPFYHPIQTVFALNANDIWFAGNGVSRWDGQRFIEMPIPASVWGPNRMNKIWGSSSSDIYVVGDNGSIAHYNGSTWQRVESGTTLPISDIWGSNKPPVGEIEILCIASRKFQNIGKKVLRIGVLSVSTLSDSGLPFYFSGMWFEPNKRYYIVGPGIYQKRSADDNGLWVGYPSGVVTSFYTNSIHGQAINDVVAAGAFGEVVHFNGKTWMNYYSITQLASGSYYSVKIKGNMIVAVGSLYDRAVVLRGTR